MPTYIYRREDGSTFEITQRITEDALTTCPTTGQSVKRVISGAGLVFKGSGFYLTDYARKNTSTSTSDGKSDAAKPAETSATSSSETAAAKTTE